ncbi:MAG TPA: phenylalanine--tRNA ligase subunit alpha, partial [Campylobacterales bacterium]|nr:phenylalanine--tRNA ligase subunit alpha [Campylobacterales bacterium]
MKYLEEKISQANSLEELEQIRVELFGKKGELAKEFAKLKDIPPKEKKAFAQGLNEKKSYLQKLYEEIYETLKKEEIERLLKA